MIALEEAVSQAVSSDVTYSVQVHINHRLEKRTREVIRPGSRQIVHTGTTIPVYWRTLPLGGSYGMERVYNRWT